MLIFSTEGTGTSQTACTSHLIDVEKGMISVLEAIFARSMADANCLPEHLHPDQQRPLYWSSHFDMASLLGLPREIRNIIYEDCLVSRGIIEPCLLWCNRDGGVWLFSRGPDKLDIALLRVSKSVRSETEKIFYGQNVSSFPGLFILDSSRDLELSFSGLSSSFPRFNLFHSSKTPTLNFCRLSTLNTRSQTPTFSPISPTI